MHQAEAEAKREAEVSRQPASKPKSPKSGRKGGRPKKAGSRRDVAARTGMDPAEQRRIERHVELAERFPFTTYEISGARMAGIRQEQARAKAQAEAAPGGGGNSVAPRAKKPFLQGPGWGQHRSRASGRGGRPLAAALASPSSSCSRVYLGGTMTARLGTVIKALRESKGMSQVELASKAKIARPYLIRLESGQQKNPSLAVLKRLAGALGVPVAGLLE
jgi:DNA-binding XRE family transcriptional regulator